MESLACVIGDLSLVRPLGRVGIPVAVVTVDRQANATRSRFCKQVVVTPSFADRPAEAVAALTAFGADLDAPAVLFPQGDHDLLALSRHRQDLAAHFRMALPPAELVEALVDKLAFARLAVERGLAVPETAVLRQGHLDADVRAWRTFPCVVKPAMRTHWFRSRLSEMVLRGNQKAIRAESKAELETLAPILREHGGDFVVQEAIPGGEERILSYHAYLRPGGDVAGEFTGKKVRTSPRIYGLSSCVEITDDDEVRELGRRTLARLHFTGVVKLDFKSDPRTSRLYLLEANPRFNLWHHPGAIAGVNLPALVYGDLVGVPWISAQRVRPGVRWMSAREDFAAMREYRRAGELGIGAWLRDFLRADVREDLMASDPRPTLALAVEIIERQARRVHSTLTAPRTLKVKH